MTDDTNKQQNDPKQSGKEAGQQQQRKIDEISQKRPSQGGTDVEQHQEKQHQGGQRQAS
jgi:hypothetical protein